MYHEAAHPAFHREVHYNINKMQHPVEVVGGIVPGDMLQKR
jgi:hypothetical protein